MGPTSAFLLVSALRCRFRRRPRPNLCRAAQLRRQELTFELWCQETQRYPAERCDARRPADVAAFEAYRASIERYELQYLKQVDRERQIRDSVNRDPMQSTISRQEFRPLGPAIVNS